MTIDLLVSALKIAQRSQLSKGKGAEHNPVKPVSDFAKYLAELLSDWLLCRFF